MYLEGRRVLNVSWDDGPNKDLNDAAVTASLKQAAAKKFRRYKFSRIVAANLIRGLSER